MFFAILYPIIPQYKGLISVKTFFIRTYGCQMNFRDSEKLSGLLTQLGYTAAQSQEDAGLILYNTCCVRESAEDKIWGHLSRLKNLKSTKPDLIIAVTGCMSQQPEIAETFRKKHPYVNIVLGTTNRHRFPEFLMRAIQTGQQIIDISEDDQLPELTGIPVTTREYPHKAGVNIMYGCDNYCSYCIVPYVRGREISRVPESITEEMRLVAQRGALEITLLGQNVNSYVSDGTDFSALLKIVADEAAKSGIRRVRFLSANPRNFSSKTTEALASNDCFCRHIHLPVQHGSNSVLEAMNRGYTRERFLELIGEIRSAMPGVTFSTDILMGFPGETEDDVEKTLSLMEEVKFLYSYMYHFNPREGTKAFDLLGRIDEDVKRERLSRVIDLQLKQTKELLKLRIGSTETVLVEGISRKNADELITRTEKDEMVAVPGSKSLVGSFVKVTLSSLKGNTLRAKKVL